MEINANVKFFFEMAVKKSAAKLADQGFGPEAIAQQLSMPGHLLDLLDFAKDLHMQAVDKLAHA